MRSPGGGPRSENRPGRDVAGALRQVRRSQDRPTSVRVQASQPPSQRAAVARLPGSGEPVRLWWLFQAEYRRPANPVICHPRREPAWSL